MEEKQTLSTPIQDSTSKIVVISLIIGLIGGAIGGSLGPQYFNFGSKIKSQKSLTEEIAQKGTIKIEEESSTTDAVAKVSPAVVSIIISKDLSKYYNNTGNNIFPFDNFFDFGFPFNTPKNNTNKSNEKNIQEIGGGTGFIISSDGLILTNKHVVSDNEAEYTVLTNDGEKYSAKVLGQDPVNDIALVKIEAKDLPIVELGDSDSIKLGQTVIAIGNALSEFRNTVTKGIISGINRRVTAGGGTIGTEVIEEAIQTDAAINPGNSGGPLINLAGQVIGVNTAVSQAGQLIGFAIPINLAKNVIDSIKQYGRVVRPYLGVRYVIINDQIAEENKLKVNYGALIIRGAEEGQLAVVPGSPADKAGLVENDIILTVNGVEISTDHSLANEIGKYKPDEVIELKILHKGEEMTIKVKLGEFKE